MVRLGHDNEVTTWLDDPAPLARAIARDAARRAGIDALAYYRSAVTVDVSAPGPVAGLAETGTEADVALLQDLLTHPRGRIRVQAVRGLRHLQTVRVERMLPLLRDPSAAVVREATAALRPLARAVPDQECWNLLADPRVAPRRAGYRLLSVRGPV